MKDIIPRPNLMNMVQPLGTPTEKPPHSLTGLVSPWMVNANAGTCTLDRFPLTARQLVSKFFSALAINID